MELRINISKNGMHYFYATVSGAFYSEREIYKKIIKDYSEEEGFEVSILRVYTTHNPIKTIDLLD